MIKKGQDERKKKKTEKGGFQPTSEATTKVTGPRPSENVNMNMHSHKSVSILDQSSRNALPTIARQNVTSTLLTKNSGRRPILLRKSREGHVGR